MFEFLAPQTQGQPRKGKTGLFSGLKLDLFFVFVPVLSGDHAFLSLGVLLDEEQGRKKKLCCILPRDVGTEQLFANKFGFSVLNH